MTKLIPKYLMAKLICLLVLTFAICLPASASERRAISLTFLKSAPNQREQLKQFITLNWFAMDKIAVANGLMDSYSVTDTGSDDGSWNVLVTTVYKNEAGYDGIKDAFDKISQQHTTVLVEGKSLRELGSIVDDKTTFETISPLPNLAAEKAKLARNKANVLGFYDLMFNQARPAQAMQQYGASEYRQHNPDLADGRAAFVAYFEAMAKKYPGKSVSFKRVVAEDNFVVVHSEHVFPGWSGGSWAAIDIFRLEPDGKIAEHWDVLQKVPSHSANSNGMF
jgi:predicted SnoaL-like aldol condensation-catalyzing enzyme